MSNVQEVVDKLNKQVEYNKFQILRKWKNLKNQIFPNIKKPLLFICPINNNDKKSKKIWNSFNRLENYLNHKELIRLKQNFWKGWDILVNEFHVNLENFKTSSIQKKKRNKFHVMYEIKSDLKEKQKWKEFQNKLVYFYQVLDSIEKLQKNSTIEVLIKKYIQKSKKKIKKNIESIIIMNSITVKPSFI